MFINRHIQNNFKVETKSIRVVRFVIVKCLPLNKVWGLGIDL